MQFSLSLLSANALIFHLGLQICDLTTVTSVATAATAVAAADAAIPSSTLGSTTLSSSYSAASTTAITELLSIPLLPSPGQEVTFHFLLYYFYHSV